MSINVLLSSVAITGAVGAFVSIMSQIFKEYINNRNEIKVTMSERVDKLTKSLKEAAILVETIEEEIKSRSQLATKLKTDIEQYNNIAELKKTEIEAVVQLLRGELKNEGKKTFWIGFGINLLFFIFGALTSIFITLKLK